ncbi:uncharacterized protein TNCV_4484521 [Trichonephila clavipes]|nr:uncharacterized protein TNCV_4484521 [Trichonephila clavipes]
MDRACQVETLQEHDGSIMVWVLFGIFDVLEYDVKDHHTTLTNLTEVWTDLVNIWQVIPVERFQKRVESMPRRVAAFIKDRRRPNSLLGRHP